MHRRYMCTWDLFLCLHAWLVVWQKKKFCHVDTHFRRVTWIKMVWLFTRFIRCCSRLRVVFSLQAWDVNLCVCRVCEWMCKYACMNARQRVSSWFSAVHCVHLQVPVIGLSLGSESPHRHRYSRAYSGMATVWPCSSSWRSPLWNVSGYCSFCIDKNDQLYLYTPNCQLCIALDFNTNHSGPITCYIDEHL